MPDDNTHHTKPHHAPRRRKAAPQTHPARTRAATTSQPTTTTYSSPPPMSCSHHHNEKNNPKTLTNSNKLFQIMHSLTDRQATIAFAQIRGATHLVPNSAPHNSGGGHGAHKTLATERNPRARGRERERRAGDRGKRKGCVSEQDSFVSHPGLISQAVEAASRQ